MLSEDPIPTCYSLLSRLKNWDDDVSWRDFFDTYWRLIYAVALRSGLTDAEAQDVVQETIICVAKDIHKFKKGRGRGSFKGWLRNITYWRIGDYLRKRGKMPRTDSSSERNDVSALDEFAHDPSEAVASEWETEWHRNLLKAALERIKLHVKEEQYQMFDLYVIRQWPVDRITRTLGVSATSVYLAKHRITRLIKKEVRRLEERWNCR